MITRCRWLFCLFSIVALILGIFPSLGYAEVKEIIAEGTYSMGDGETPMVAEERCLLAAKRVAIEQAGTYVQSFSEIKNYQLTADEVQVISSGIMEVTVLDKRRTMDRENINFWVKIKATVSTDKIEDMAANLKNASVTQDYKKLQGDYDKSQQEVAVLKLQLQQANNDTDKQRIRSEIANRETGFTADTWFDRGNLSMLNHQYNEAIMAYTEAIRLNPHFRRAYLGRGRAYTEVGEYQLAREDFATAHNLDYQPALSYFNQGISDERADRRHALIEVFQRSFGRNHQNERRWR